ncbi:polymorphic toxin-type HINT domain-containing protein [Streptomyces sp. NPDC004629]|uniref:polymorphic toxin-type HINT domain-containing protein n=1 Tax=Streptomyces sp. NPDC004629 TaxID=3364705 RepID=UPI003679EE87
MYGISRARRAAVQRRRVALGVSAVLIATLLQAVASAPVADAAGRGRPAVTDPDKPVTAGAAIKAKPRKVMKGPRTPHEAPKAAWPATGSAVVALKEPQAKAGDPVKAKGLPLELTTPAKRVKSATGGHVEARVLGQDASRKAGIDGLLVTLEAQDQDAAGSVGATVDYSSFAQAFGGSYASRLTLVELPACVLTSPAKDACRTTAPVASDNDTEAQTLTASAVSVRPGSPTVLAVVADDSGKTGDYKATPLSASSTWSTSLNSGSFGWSYGIPVPAVPGGLSPSVGLSYSSGGIDGRTGNSNNQSSWVGDGFDLSPGFIERRYKPCADDGQKADNGVSKPGDLCWGYDNAYISLNGKSGELVPVGDDEWRLKDDDGTRVARLTETARGNGDDDNEYWRVTTADGTRYYFGYNRLEGWAAGKETTDSTWTVPVYGNDAGEPCHAAAFADSWCRQAWRWNLDYVIGTHGNAIAYYYDKEENSYGRNLKKTDDTRYTRGGYLDRIEYGVRWDQVYSAKPLAKVDFTSSERCLPDSATDCSSISKDAFYWYDTPWDMNCEADTDCDASYSPTFWTRKRLTGISTQVLNAGAYSPVDSWKLTHRWGQADVDYQLLLDSVQHTGHTAATPITLPPTTFAYTQLENRLDKTGDGYAPFVKARLSTISDEYGGETDVNYSEPACKADSLPTPETNTTRCFPQMLGGTDTEDPERHWFNKYVVTSVTATDRTGGAPDAVTAYEYLDGGAWHYDDDDGLTKEKNKTWSQWRGYGHVRVKTGGQGGSAAMKTQQDSYFLRGMDGDRKDSSGGTKTVNVTLGAGEGDPIADHESAAGFQYRTETYSGPGGKVLAKTVNRPWHYETGKKVRSWGTVTSNFTGTANTQTFTSLDNGAGTDWRIASKSMKYDTVAGRLTQTADNGETGVADNTCTRITYATNTSANILTLVSRTETVGADCTTTPDRAKDVLSDVRTAYDGGAYNSAPTKGDITATATLSKHNGTTATYLETGTTYDSYGRPLTVTDLTADVTATEAGTPVRSTRTDGLTSTTTYTPATGFPTTVTTKTPPAQAADTTTAQTTTSTLDPLRGQPTAEEDTNGKVTAYTYDALGRSDKIWLADRKTDQAPTYDFDYFIEDSKPATVRTLTLNNNGGQIPSYTLYDGLLRARQTQDTGPNGGSLIADTFYDERGQVAKTFATYYTATAPSRVLFPPAKALSVETQTWHTYDGLGRETESRNIAGNGDGGTVLGITQTIYGGDRTTVIPPQGGTATTTLTDVRGQTTELRQHHTRSASAAYDTTSYKYDLADHMTKVTDPAGNAWTYEYDLLGRQTRTVAPDKGATDTRYDDRGRITTTTTTTKNPGDTVLYHAYDQLGRQTELREKNATGLLRAAWTYDTVAGAKGQPASATRYVNGAAYTSKVTLYDRLYRPQRTSVTIPDTTENKGLAGTYQAGTSYKPSGLVAGVSYSAAGSLPGGGYAYTYDDTLRPITLLGDGFQTDVTSYSLTGKPLQYSYHSTASGAKEAWVTNTYEWGTQRLATSRVDRYGVAGVDRQNTYHYDQTGNVLSVTDVSRAGTDNQCFTYDYLRCLTEAWTEGDTSCETAPRAGSLGTVAPYWHSYTYDKTGGRKTETLHDIAGDTSKDVQRTYTYPPPGTAQPHTLTEVNQSGPTGTAKTAYSYDLTGNTTGRTISGDTQGLDWDAEGRLAKVTQPVPNKPDEVTEYIYDADGNRLIARGPNETTLYIGNTELVLAKGATTPKATRYIDLGSGSQAVQSDDGKITITVADHLGTGQLAIGVADLALSQRRTLPFGGNRGNSTGTWPGTKGYIGGTDDTATTGLTHLGAREYDPTTGRFISVDPLMDLSDPQSINGYAYADNNPVTLSDPAGTWIDDGTGHSEPHPRSGNHGSNVGVPRGGTGPSGCYYTCSKNSASSTGRTTTTKSELMSYLPRPENGWNEDRFRIVWFDMGGTTQYGGYWDAQVGDGDRTAMACFGRTACRKAFSYVANGGSFAKAKEIAATYCVTHSHECGVDAGAYKAMKEAAELVPILLAGEAATALNKIRQGAGCTHSFADGTQVLLADGTHKNIEDVTVDDVVLATDPDTGKTVTHEVVRTILTKDDKDFIALTIKDKKSGDVHKPLIATTTHPFWSPSERRWLDAGDLQPGMTLRTSDGRQVEVATVRHFTKPQITHDLTIEDVHTYYVLAGETPVLVHNSGPWCGVGPAEAQEIIQNAKGYGSGLKRDAGHRAADFVVGDIATKGVTTRLVGGDGVERLLVQMPGEMNGKAGRFEWLVERGGSGNLITHQRFVNGGSMNGIPNKR